MARILLLLLLAVATNFGCSGKDADESPGPKTLREKKRAAPTQLDPAKSSDEASSNRGATGDQISAELRDLFARLDKLGRIKIKGAKFVELEFSSVEGPERKWTEKAWLVSQDDESTVVMKDDLLLWTYRKNSSTTVPSSWRPSSVHLKSIKDADFEILCQKLSKPDEEPKDDRERARRSLHAPGPSYRVLIAHAAWKQGLTNYCEAIVSIDPKYKANFKEYQSAVLEDLAWLHFLRGVNLLMFAERKQVLPHLRLVADLSPKGKFTAQSKDLIDRLEKLVSDKKKPRNVLDESMLSDAEKAQLFVSRFKDLRCPQISQPGQIVPYMAIVDGKPDRNPPTLKLKKLGMSAVPALIEALEDDTPTRTVYHWRDFQRSRVVWRVSDFAWYLLRDITKKEFGDRRVVGFTLSSMQPEEKRQVIKGIKKWHTANKDLSPDDRMFEFFSSRNSDDWITAGKFFLKMKDKRAVKPLLDKIPVARSFRKGDLCELVAKFGDPSAKDVIKQVMETASGESDRLSAAIALWTLGDPSGVPVVVAYVKAKEQPYGTWDEPIWFLMRTRSKEGMGALKSVVTEAPARRAKDVIEYIIASISGDLWGEKREPAGCLEICPVLIAAMDREDSANGALRIKDNAAKAFAVLRQGTDGDFGGRFVQVDPKLFNEREPDESKRDVQIQAHKAWYEKNKGKLEWDSKKGRLVVKK